MRVFLGSPGDLEDERIAAKGVVDELNELLGANLGYHVELVRWETVVSAFGRPQGIINRELERCELFIGMLWKRWGTPPSKDGPYSSGFDEEFSISSASCAATGKPEISLFFKNVDPGHAADPGDELKKVLRFKQTIIDEKTVMFDRFEDAAEFTVKLRRCITQYLFKLRDQEQKAAAEDSQSLPSEKVENAALPTTTAVREDIPVSSEGVAFLRDLIRRMEQSGDQDVAAIDVARFRLLSGMLYRAGNDERTLGVHDANLLYVERDRTNWGTAESDGLMRAGCEHFPDEIVPLWGWLAKFDGYERGLLPLFAFGGDSSVVRGALRAMRLLGEPLNVGKLLPREAYLKSWFSADSAIKVRAAALEYLGDNGLPADLPDIRVELDRKNYQTSGEAALAIIKIALRQSRASAITAITDLQPESVPQALAEEIFSTDAVDAGALSGALAHKSLAVRRVALRQLAARRQLTREAAQQLLNDSDPQVRLEALLYLHKNEVAYPLANAKDILVRPKRTAIGGLFGMGMGSDEAGENAYNEFKRHHWSQMKDAELAVEAAAGLILDEDAYFANAERHFHQQGAEIRTAINDEYTTAFAREIGRLKSRHGETAGGTIDKLGAQDAKIRRGLTRSAMSVVSRSGNASDLPLMRIALGRDGVRFLEDDIAYLEKFGEWEDIKLVIKAAEQNDGASMLSIPDPKRARRAARAIIRMGQKRLSELLELDMPDDVLGYVIRQATAYTFKALADSQIEELLRNASSAIRKSVALKCARHLPRRRLAKLLEAQLTGHQSRYYNVSHWLDFGINAPRDRMLISAQAELNRMDQLRT